MSAEISADHGAYRAALAAETIVPKFA